MVISVTGREESEVNVVYNIFFIWEMLVEGFLCAEADILSRWNC